MSDIYPTWAYLVAWTNFSSDEAVSIMRSISLLHFRICRDHFFWGGGEGSECCGGLDFCMHLYFRLGLIILSVAVQAHYVTHFSD